MPSRHLHVMGGRLRLKHRTRVLPILLAFALIVSGFQFVAASPANEMFGSTTNQTVQQEGTGALTAQDLAIAMDVPAEDIVNADLMGSDPRGVAIMDQPLGTAGFPTAGNTFIILSTGEAAKAASPNDSGWLSGILDGLNNNSGHDMVSLALDLQAPEDARCLGFDFAFYSEEYPEYVGKGFNDIFTAAIDDSGNFAFDEQGNPISVDATFGMTANTGTTYDGGTPRLKAQTQVEPGSAIKLVLSIQDQGDDEYDSAVFVDNFFWSPSVSCEKGAQVIDVQTGPAIYYVDVDATGNGTGDSWADAFLTLQDALKVAVPGNQIWVAQGIYYPDMGGEQADNDRNASFNIPAGVALYGGFDPGAGVEEMDARDWTIYTTVLSGDIDQNDTTDANGVVVNAADISGGNSYHVIYLDGTDESGTTIQKSTLIDGFVITAGLADGEAYPDDAGGALLCNGFGAGSECSPRVTNVTFSGNRSNGNGGAVFNDGRESGLSNPAFTNVIFSGNSALFGGALYNYGGSGGQSNPALTNVLFQDNLAEVWGGAMLNQGERDGNASPTLVNVTFSGNGARAGGAIFNFGDNGKSSPTLTNTILWGNSSSEDGASIYLRNANVTVRYSIVENGADGIGAEGAAAITYASTNSESDPLFVSDNDLHLQTGSPAIDAGDNTALPVNLTMDLAGNERIVNGVVDLGAYEFVVPPVTWEIQNTFQEGQIATTAWSPKGDLVALGTTDGTVFVWSVTTGETVMVFDGNIGVIRSITWSPDATYLAAASTDGENDEVLIWSLETGEDIAGFGGNYGGIFSIAWSSGGRFLASGLGDGSVLVYDMQAFEEVSTLEALGGMVSSVAWSPDGSQLAASTEAGSVVMWRTGTWETLGTFESSEGAILSISWSPDGSMLVCGFASGLVLVSDVATMKTVARFETQNGMATFVAWSPDGAGIAVGTEGGVVQIWNTQTWVLAGSFDAQGAVTSVSWSPGSSWVVVAASGAVQVWRKNFAPPPSTWRPKQEIKEDTGVISTAISPYGDLVASGLGNGTVIVRRVKTQEVVTILEGLPGPVNSVTWSPKGDKLAAGSNGGTVLVWLVRSWDVVTTFVSDAGDVISLTWSPDGGMVVCGFSSGVVIVGDVTSGEAVATIEGPAGGVTSVLWLGNRLVGGSDDGTAWVWDTSSWETVTVFEGEVSVLTVTLSPDGTMLICGLADGTVVVGDVTSGEIVRTVEVSGGGGITSVVWLGGDLVVVDEEGTLTTLDTVTWEIRIQTKVADGNVTDATISSDGDTLTIGTDDGTVRVIGTNVLDLRGVPGARLQDPGRYYRLQTMFLEAENKCLEGSNTSTDLSQNRGAFMDDCQNVTGQLWKFVDAGNGYYRLQNMSLEDQNKCLEGNRLAPGSVLNGAAFMDDCQNVTGQLWKLVDAGGGYFRLQTLFLETENRCLEGNRVAPESVLGGPAFMDLCQNVTGQLWKLVPTPYQTLAIGTWVSLQSFNFPDRYIRHTSFKGRIDPIQSDLERKDSTFRVVKGLAGDGGSNFISLESANFPNYFLVVEGDTIALRERDPSDEEFAKNATFIVRRGLGDARLISLESYALPGHYVRHSSFVLYVHPAEDSDLFKADATFRATAPNWTP